MYMGKGIKEECPTLRDHGANWILDTLIVLDYISELKSLDVTRVASKSFTDIAKKSFLL